MSKVAHRFLRQPNHASDIWSRIGNRHNPFKNTLTVLQDPKNNRKLHLIGTTNSSTSLAYRTKKIISQIKPASVYVQASADWWNVAKCLNVETQAQFNAIKSALPKEHYKFQNHLRGILFRARYYTWFWSLLQLARLPSDFNLIEAGLETKFALQEAHKAGSQIVFGGQQFDNIAIEALKTQPDMYPYTALWRARKFNYHMSTITGQYKDLVDTMHARGGEAFAESIDRSRINFIVHLLNRVSPKQKEIIVDQRDERIFRDIYDLKGQTIVAVVNQWHMQGVQTRWRVATQTHDRSEVPSPVHDMNIDAYSEAALVNDFLRDYTSQVTKSEPGTHQNAQTNYHKENFEYERTRHTHHTSHQDIPEPGEKKGSHH